jgi:hypothetical protein
MTAVPQPAIVVREMDEWQSRAAFVIQFREGTDIGAGRLVGRVEHIASYKAARFHSLEDLLSFIARVLDEMEKQA